MTQENLRLGRIVLRSARIGLIICEIAKRLGISTSEALRRFYQSATCRDFHDRSTGMYLQGDLYVVEEFMSEIR
jgi:transposase-like protein